MAADRSLPPDMLLRLNQLLQSCADTREYLTKCRNCHLDVDKETRDNDEQQKIAEAMKREFFPGEV